MKTELRMIVFPEPDNKAGIYEVHTEDDGTLVSFASMPASLVWPSESVPGVKQLTDRIQLAMMKTWLSPKDFGIPV